MGLLLDQVLDRPIRVPDYVPPWEIPWPDDVPGISHIWSPTLVNAVAFVQKALNQSNGTNASAFTTSNALSPATTAGNMLVANISCSANKNVTSVTDSAGNTYIKAVALTGASYWKPEIWYCPNASAVATNGTFTVNMDASCNIGIIVDEYSGLGSSPTVSDTGTRNQGSGSTNWGTLSSAGTTATGDLVTMAAASDNNSNTVTFSTGNNRENNSSFSGGNPGKGAADVLSASSGTQSFSNTWSSSGDGGQCLVSFTPTAAGGTTVTPGVINLILTEYAPVLAFTIYTGVTALILAEFAPSVILGTVLKPGVLNLTLSEFAPSLIAGTVVTPGVVALTLTGYAPVLTSGTGVTPDVLALSLTEYAPVLVAGTVLTPGVNNLTLTGYAPTITVTGPITPSPVNLVLTSYAPTITTPQTVTPDLISLALTGYSPTVTVNIGIQAGGYPPVRRVTRPSIPLAPIFADPLPLHLTLQSYSPNILVTTTIETAGPELTYISVGTLNLTVSSFTPDVVATTIDYIGQAIREDELLIQTMLNPFKT